MTTLRLLGRHAVDRMTHVRGTRLVMGNALVARLLKSLLGRGVDVRTNSRVVSIDRHNGSAATIHWLGDQGIAESARSRRGVVLATGGFSHHADLRRELLPQPPAAYTAVPDGIDGSGVTLGLSLGGKLGQSRANNAFWAPSSVRQRSDGSTAVFPHFALDRGKPGLIAVDQHGRRFVNEATSYQMFVEAMYEVGAIPCQFICDGTFIRRYGLGMIRPRTRNLAPYVADGYLIEAPTLGALARKIGVDPDALNDTVARYNVAAVEGIDLEFNKGASAYSRNLGDPAVGPNPCLGLVGPGPFYALTIHPADIGTCCGLVTNTDAQVLDRDDRPIEGLYAVGNDMDSVMGGVYAGPGITIGTAMTFGYVAGRHAARDGA